jgi:hypothetical protein
MISNLLWKKEINLIQSLTKKLKIINSLTQRYQIKTKNKPKITSFFKNNELANINHDLNFQLTSFGMARETSQKKSKASCELKHWFFVKGQCMKV